MRGHALKRLSIINLTFPDRLPMINLTLPDYHEWGKKRAFKGSSRSVPEDVIIVGDESSMHVIVPLHLQKEQDVEGGDTDNYDPNPG